MFRPALLPFLLLLLLSSCNVMKEKSKANEHQLRKAGYAAHTFRAADGPHYTWARDTGKPKVLFLHGYPGSGAMEWAHTVHLLDDTLDAIIPDLLCHGHSTDTWHRTGPSGPLNSMEAQADHVVGLLDSLGITGPVTVVGNSYGGGVAAWLAYRHPARVGKLVVNNGLVTDYPMSMADSIARLSGEPSMRDVMSFRDHHDVKTIVRIAMYHKVPVPGSLTRQYYKLWVKPHQPAQVSLLDDLVLNEAIYGSKRFNWTMPSYFIWGERDDLIPNRVGLAMMARNGIPMDHWYIVPKTGHVPCLEHPQGFSEVLRTVLAQP